MSKRIRRRCRQVLATSLLLGNTLAIAVPVLADGTSAGTQISNTANATYEDPNVPNTRINSTSNTVIVTVSEVAGITVVASGVLDGNGGTVQVGDQLAYTFTITNVGNDPTQFRIPNLATVTGPGTVSGSITPGLPSGSLEVSYDGGTTWKPITGSEMVTQSVPPSGSVLVRVPVTVQPGAQANDVITVTLGDTPGDAQNQARNPDGGDVYTVDNPDNSSAAGEVKGLPVNGVREASATREAIVNSTLKTFTLATILKNRTAYDNAGTGKITDDTVTYDLSVRVESSDPTGNGITPAPLVGTPLSVNGTTAPRILVSDAIPDGTDLAVVPMSPPGWKAVYTTDPIATTDANSANWKEFPLQGSDTLSAITRVGFVNVPGIISSVAPGTTVNGFSIELKVESNATSQLTIANIAQLFGQTPGTNVPVYDESGDQSPSNYNPDGTPLAGTDTNGDRVPDAPTSGTFFPATIVDDGHIATPNAPETGTDSGNNNTGDTNPNNPAGSEVRGEANVFNLEEPIAAALQNGPESTPDAIGPTSNNDDFTNKSSLVPPNLPAATAQMLADGTNAKLDPASVPFTNTVKNNGTDAGVVILKPIAPPDITHLPNGTIVTITYGSDSVEYSYNAGVFSVVKSTTNGQPITIPNMDPGEVVNYGVEVNLPDKTPLSTDINRGFPVFIEAGIDNYKTDSNNDGIKDSGADGTIDAKNVTIDRVYTGYLKNLKESRVLPGTGPAVPGSDGVFSAEPKKPAPGNILEYRIKYTNISEPQAGSGNIILNADKVVIVEDGTLSTAPGDGKNNWALDNDGDGKIDTSNVAGSAADSGAATITFFSGKPATASSSDQTGTTVDTDVTKYVDTVTGIVSPGQSRSFSFQRKVN